MADSPSLDEIIFMLSGEFSTGIKEKFGKLMIDNNYRTEFIKLGLSENPKVAFRSAWAVSWAFSRDNSAIIPYFELITDTFIKSDNGSVHREYSKIIFHLLNKTLVSPESALKEQLAERCFDLFINPGTKVAVKVWVMDILGLLRKDIDWVAENLSAVVHVQLATGNTPGLESRARKLLKKLDA